MFPSFLHVVLWWFMAISPTSVYGQVASNSTCLSGFSWIFNSKNQDPCLVAAYLQSSCSSGLLTMKALQPNEVYQGPSSEEANPCQCSSVVYSLVSACSACQGQMYESWDTWNQNCQEVYVKLFPEVVPSETTVPIWAYMDIESNGTFNLAVAEIVALQGIPDLSTAFGPTTDNSSVSPPVLDKTKTCPGIDTTTEKAVIATLSTVLFLLISFATLLWWRRQQGVIKPSHQQPFVQKEGSRSVGIRIQQYKEVVDAAIAQSRRSVTSAWHRREDSSEPLMDTHGAWTGLPRVEKVLLPTIMTSESELRLPSLFEPQDREETYTPAMESSVAYNTTPGHSPDAERVRSETIVPTNGPKDQKRRPVSCL